MQRLAAALRTGLMLGRGPRGVEVSQAEFQRNHQGGEVGKDILGRKKPCKGNRALDSQVYPDNYTESTVFSSEKSC